MIFDLSLDDEYIQNLDYEDSVLLIKEINEWVSEEENEIIEYVGALWITPNSLKPSQVSWDPDLYPEDIAEKPWLRENLLIAEEIAAKIGRALAIQATAEMNRMRIERELDA